MGANNSFTNIIEGMGPINRLTIEPEKLSKLDNIQSERIKNLLFAHFPKKKSLEIIRYNKRIQNILNLDIKDYKEQFEKFSSIEIEIIPNKNQIGEFINMYDIEDYYHIYFNDRKKESHRNYLIKNDIVSNIRVVIDYQVKSFHKLFDNCSCVKSINFKRFNRNTINNMSYMFSKCSSLKEIIFSGFNTENVTNLSHMFDCCSSLKELDLSKFNTSNVTDMSYLFNECESLSKLNLNSFNTSKVMDMSYMFHANKSLKELNLSNFNTRKVVDMSFMFRLCTSLTKLNISNFNTSNLINMS